MARAVVAAQQEEPVVAQPVRQLLALPRAQAQAAVRAVA
jgi:hypothetical protein